MDNLEKIIIGIDGVPYSLIDRLSDQGVMPFFSKLKKESLFSKMDSSIPFISSVSWSSIITGKNPGEHGIFGFTGIIPGTYTTSFPNFLSLKAKPFWQERKDKKYLIINVPATYPAQKINGIHISGFVSPTLKKAVYPSSELSYLKKIDYQVDLDSEKVRQSPYLLYNQLEKVHLKREETLFNYLDKLSPQILMYVITGSDRLGHHRWHDWEGKQSDYHQSFLKYFKLVDQTIKKIVERSSANTPLLILSDHGMENADYDVNLNQYLIETGFLDIGSGSSLTDIKANSQAFALEHGRIYLHYADNYPSGQVKNGDQRLTIINKLEQLFDKIEVKDRKVIKKIYRKEEIYRGDQVGSAPDLILVPNRGFNLLAKLDNQKYSRPFLTGVHNSQAFLLVRSKKIKVIDKPQVEDIVSIINRI